MKEATLVTLALALALGASAARAAELTHTVAAGETLATLAAQYYGSSWKSVYLAARNGLAEDKPPSAGTRLVIPACFTYKVRRGDSLAEIARRYLGDRERYKILMQENGLKDPAELEVGAELLMPFHLRHAVAPGEGLSHIARRYYRTTRRASLLKDYNGGNENLNPGDKLTIPIFDRATLDAAKRRPAPVKTATGSVARSPEPASATAVRTSTAASGTVRSSISRAADDYRRGEFETACPKLEGLLGESGLSAGERSVIVSHLGFCAIAAGDPRAASDYFRKWLEIEPEAQLDPILTSPKILAVFAEVTEELRGSEGGRE